MMRILFFAGILFFAIACGSGENSNTPLNNENNNTPNKGNSAGSNIIEMDTMHMDTSIQEPSDRRQ